MITYSKAWCPQSTTKLPVRGISTYVLKKLPVALATIGIDLNEVDELLAQSYDRINSPLARLDCKMLEIALVQSGLPVPTKLTRLIDEISLDRSKGILYEEIVEANPIDYMRCFSTGKVRETEKEFYLVHQQIEEALLPHLKQLRIEPSLLDPNTLKASLTEVISLTASLARMPKGHFDIFRPYLGSHPVRGTKGPSGLFSAGMVELQLRSGFVPSGFVNFLHENLVYFPVRAWPNIQVALHELEPNTTHIQENAMVVQILKDFWQSWRKVHLSSIRHQVPDITKGTGGESDPITFLEDRIDPDP